ncbi:hypothetical protein TSOC_000237 [Tetrabaena socialis]|uniref:Uncharacterized protein n=1 Tax=Tetrabaena socialis TaxID=47790 RepID=A0A2J8AJV5_9CHLO|nr:hypothetical protein TSOC_000237 [Tetrabaena socialis]|eukprot:PNH12806.1 hypothetical protein TSOC_000237 [Tetrabaena socialis]
MQYSRAPWQDQALQRPAGGGAGERGGRQRARPAQAAGQGAACHRADRAVPGALRHRGGRRARPRAARVPRPAQGGGVRRHNDAGLQGARAGRLILSWPGSAQGPTAPAASLGRCFPDGQ